MDDFELLASKENERVKGVISLLISETGRREKAEEALKTIYENCCLQPEDHFVFCIKRTIESIIPNIRVDTHDKLG